MALPLYVALVFQVVGLVVPRCRRLLRMLSSSQVLLSQWRSIPVSAHQLVIPIVVASALGGFFGFLLVVFGGLYLIRRRRRSKDVSDVIEGAHFPTMAYNPYPITRPPVSAHPREYRPHVGYDYSRWDKSDDSKTPPTPPGLPTCVIRS
ncbi:hypothetical protein RHS01_10662 [Rhizoctonia solani]|uniref:Uncharacterized protein n=1 Tax=Rhizoctonia solani TaxID=456999 RepID=A0A8H7M295_9AGAM|nr:hypothetical protein RHS01_10662 [Rhizoctonia solani]